MVNILKYVIYFRINNISGLNNIYPGSFIKFIPYLVKIEDIQKKRN